MDKDDETKAWRLAYKESCQEHIPEGTTNFQNVFTPYDLCYDMIRKLETYSGGFKDKTFCVFNLEFAEVLCYILGIDREKIWFVTDCEYKKRFAEAERYNGINVKLTEFGTFLKENWDMKFDCVIGNPPYQAPKERKAKAVNGTCGAELWDKFIEKSTELVKENGFVTLIHPPKWRKPDHKAFRFIHERDLKYLEIHSIDDGLKVFRASTAYDWYILKNSKYNGKTVIKNINGNMEEIDISNFLCIPSGSFNLFKQLLAKDGEEKCEIIYNRTNYGHDKKWVSKDKNEKYQYPCIYSLTRKDGLKLVYSMINNQGHFGIKKVVLPMSKYTDTFIDEKGEYGICEFAFGIKFDTLKEAEGIKKAIMSEKFKAIWQATEWICNSKEWRIFKSFKKDFWKEFV